MNAKVRSTHFNDFSLFSKPLNQLPQTEKLVINTINQYSYCVACKDKNFKKALIESEVLLPDGIAIVIANKFVNGRRIQKISGSDIHKYFLNKLNKEGGSCFYLGSSEQSLKKIKQKLNLEFPNITTNSYSPPFRRIFSESDSKKMVEAVNKYKPDVLFIGMTAPKQEKWALEYKKDLDAKFICCIGAVFDFYSGTVTRPSRIWQNLGLEWLGRLIREPKRMWKRYLYYGPIFIYYVFFKRNILK